MHTNRILFLDIETTGLNLCGNKIIELGIVESIDGLTTNNNMHLYFNPGDVKIDPGATKVHNITQEDVINKKPFSEHAEEIIKFVEGSHSLIAHNAIFDVSFISQELLAAGFNTLDYYVRSIKDSIALARKLYPAKPNDLSSLCKRLDISLDTREFHGALVDALLLQKAFFAMINRHEEHEQVKSFNRDIKITAPYLRKLVTKTEKFTATQEDVQQDEHVRFLLSLSKQIKLLETELI